MISPKSTIYLIADVYKIYSHGRSDSIATRSIQLPTGYVSDRLSFPFKSVGYYWK